MAEPQLPPQFGDEAPTPTATIAVDRAIPAQYDLLLSKIALADHELDLKGVGGRGSHLEEASGIVFDLLYSLDFKNGGELVPRLAALYGYIGNELLNVGRTGDRVQLGHLRDMIETLKQSW
jgi:flagellin-specific chaperone FliS